MRKTVAIFACFLATLTTAFAQSVTAEMVVSPTHARSDVEFAAGYSLKDTACPAGKPVDFTWQSVNASTPLGSSTLQQNTNSCRATLATTAPPYDRNSGAYTICGNYTTPEQQTIIACDEYQVDPGGPTSSPSPSPSASGGNSPGGNPTGPGGATGPGSGGSGPGHSGSVTASPANLNPTPGTGGSAAGKGFGSSALPIVGAIAGALVLAGVFFLAVIRGRRT